MSNNKNTVTTASVSSYFTKNLQQIGFSTPAKAVLTTLKEAVDNSLDACEENGILPEIKIIIEKLGPGTSKGTDKIRILIEDNGPGIPLDLVDKVFGEFLASSKFGRGRATRGQQGLGISAAVAYAQLTQARGVLVTSKLAKDKKGISCLVEVDIKNNKGVIKDLEKVDLDRKHGTTVEFIIDGRLQINGDAGLITYLTATSLVNPHLTLEYKLLDQETVRLERVSNEVRKVPPSVNPHPHTLKLGEFISHGHTYHNVKVKEWLKNGFTRISDSEIKKVNLPKLVSKNIDSMTGDDFKELYSAVQELTLMPPSTKSVVSMGEEALSKSVSRLGAIDFFSVVTRRPVICDFKPVQIEVAMARLVDSGQSSDDPVQLLRFSNFVPLQFDKSSCISTKAIESVNWKAYGMGQPKNALPLGPYVLAVSIVSPFIKFKNASKETIDGGEELLEEIRRALIQVGQKLAKHIKAEAKKQDLEAKRKYIEQFGPILIDCLMEITSEKKTRIPKLQKGLKKILGRDTDEATSELKEAEEKVEKLIQKEEAKNG